MKLEEFFSLIYYKFITDDFNIANKVILWLLVHRYVQELRTS